jgi:uroporphyrinogen decarboxylase
VDSRERTFLALRHETPDRIPADFWASPGMRERILAEMGLAHEEFLDEFDIDFRYIAGPDYVGPPLTSSASDTEVDIWGVPRRGLTLEVLGHLEHYREVTEPPLSGAFRVEDVEDYAHWPSADWFDYKGIEAQCAAVRDGGRVAVFMGDRLNRIAQLKPAMYIRGVENIMLDMAIRPALARAVFGRIKAFYLEYLTRILESASGKLDIVLTGDDFGAQDGLLVSPSMWSEFLSEGFRQYNELIGAHGVVAMHHTCGSVVELIPAMIDNGLDVLQSLQPEARGMDPASLKRRYGRRLCFHGGVSVQRTLPRGTPDDVRQEVKNLANTMGKGGGYIFCTAHNVQADTPIENVQALLTAYRDFGGAGA